MLPNPALWANTQDATKTNKNAKRATRLEGEAAQASLRDVEAVCIERPPDIDFLELTCVGYITAYNNARHGTIEIV